MKIPAISKDENTNHNNHNINNINNTNNNNRNRSAAAMIINHEEISLELQFEKLQTQYLMINEKLCTILNEIGIIKDMQQTVETSIKQLLLNKNNLKNYLSTNNNSSSSDCWGYTQKSCLINKQYLNGKIYSNHFNNNHQHRTNNRTAANITMDGKNLNEIEQRKAMKNISIDKLCEEDINNFSENKINECIDLLYEGVSRDMTNVDVDRLINNVVDRSVSHNYHCLNNGKKNESTFSQLLVSSNIQKLNGQSDGISESSDDMKSIQDFSSMVTDDDSSTNMEKSFNERCVDLNETSILSFKSLSLDPIDSPMSTETNAELNGIKLKYNESTKSSSDKFSKLKIDINRDQNDNKFVDIICRDNDGQEVVERIILKSITKCEMKNKNNHSNDEEEMNLIKNRTSSYDDNEVELNNYDWKAMRNLWERRSLGPHHRKRPKNIKK